MKTLVLTIFCISSLAFTGNSASADGYLIYNNGDTVQVEIYVPIFPTGVLHPLEFQQNPRIIENDIPKKMDLSKTVEAGFTYRDRKFVFRKMATGSKLEMKHLVREGKVQLYRDYFHSAFRMNAISSSFFLLNSDKKCFYPKPLNFRRKVANFLKADKRFRKNVRSKKFKLEDLEEMIVFYESQSALD